MVDRSTLTAHDEYIRNLYREQHLKRPRNAARALGMVCAVILACIGGSIPVNAQGLYTVSDVVVDERASSEVEAKRIGVLQAKRDAFRAVVDRLTEPGNGGPVFDPATGTVVPAAPVAETPDDERLEFMIRDMSFKDEKFGGGRYLATLTIRFNPEEINRYLQRSGMAYIGSGSPLAVILPVYRDGTGDRLWSDGNPWLDAWSRLESGGTVVPYTVPLGDLMDIGAIDAARAVALDATSINAIAARYSAGAVIIPIASPAEGGGLLVEVSTFGVGWPAEPELLRLTPDHLDKAESAADDAKGARFQVAAGLVLEALEKRWKSANILRFDQGGETLRARVQVTGLEDWLSVRTALDTVAPITNWRLAVLAMDHAILDIDYVGDTARLNQALSRVSMGLVEDGGRPGTWTISRR